MTARRQTPLHSMNSSISRCMPLASWPMNSHLNEITMDIGTAGMEALARKAWNEEHN